jgi:two-component system phosphate regulon sensor histidine kinase PhoR
MIYQNQLDAILFSVNQYSDDVVSGWVNEIEYALDDPDNTDSLIFSQLFQFHPSIFQVWVHSDKQTKLLESWDADTVLDQSFYEMEVLLNQGEELAKMKEYAENGYQKISSVPVYRDDRTFLVLYFILLSTDNEPTNNVGAIFLDPETFISETLSTKFQTVAQEKFVVSAFRKGSDLPVYSTTDSVSTGTENAIAVTNEFWLVPDYYLAIGTVGTPIQDIVRRRTIINLALLLLLIGVLGIAGFLLFRNVNRELALAQKKADFVSNVSHELRTPLALISMFAETLEMGRVKSEEKRTEYYQIMQRESSRLTGIVNKVLTFSQMESGKKQFRHDPLDLNNIVNEVMTNYEFHLKNKGFSHEKELSEIALPVKGDKEALSEVLINLLDNAIKYSKDQKHVQVSTHQSDGMAMLAVQDHGIGIPKKDQDQIFEKFFRVSVGDLAQSKGTGLGLSLVRQIVQEHKGEIWVESEVGKGSRFIIKIPLNN